MRVCGFDGSEWITNGKRRSVQPNVGSTAVGKGRQTGSHGQETQTHSQVHIEVARPRTIQISCSKQPAIGQFATLIRSCDTSVHRLVLFRASSRLQQNRRDKISHRGRTAAGVRGSRRGFAQPGPRGRHTRFERCEEAWNAGSAAGSQRNRAGPFLRPFDRAALRGTRDYAIVAVLIGSGLRRAELVPPKSRPTATRRTLGMRQPDREGWSH